jgi:AraC-like DNA-binding protein
VVFVRRGCFVRSGHGGEHLLDPTLAYFLNPGDEQRYDHPHSHGDDCTAVFLSPELVASLWRADLPSAPVPIAPRLDVRHRRLLAAARRGDGDAEGALMLAADALRVVDSARVASGRPANHAALVDGVRERLAADPNWTLTALATDLAVSPHHLSRIFRAATGDTISRHRMRIRARMALERLTNGERDLAWIAADTGFADQAHLTRVLREETAETPSALRAALAA